MLKSCPWCLEELPVRENPAKCPHCGRALGEEGEHLARQVRFQRVEADQTATFRRMLAWGAPIVAVISIAMPLVHFGALAVVPLLVGIHLVVTRVVLVRDAQRLLRPVRKFLNRWLARFAFLWIGLPGYGSMTVPLAGIVLGVGTFVLLTSVVNVSTLVGLERERAGKDLAVWEKLVPTVLAVLTVALLLVGSALALLFGWSAVTIMDRIQAP